ncbi:hypothetical protein N7466_010002 [Penicillium verhagenii]|uniref:uncharacterized protein n=1 Tax=Penicillium verhagenii TaxID=1562060 RepID=UPI00254599D1|nr:uncharacterized protein N7466_010002 [Penicillium verhagenii]KAJ5919059.1 hypothetical protein N7466_010002 [Penicillium verhagenii]
MSAQMTQLEKPADLPRSRLETLPVEILELIFLFSLEINLPRASPYLSRALSSPILFTWLIRLVFSSTNPSSRHGFFTSEFLPPPLDFWGLSLEQRQHLQTTLLACRWCTFPLMRKCQREYVEHVLRNKCANLVFSPEDQKTLENLGPRLDNPEIDRQQGAHERRGKGDLIVNAQLSDRNTETSTSTSNSTINSTKTEDENESAKSKQRVDRKVAIWFHRGAVQIREPNEVYYENDLFRLPASTPMSPGLIPDKLLQSPWSDSQFDFLHLLSSDFYIDDDIYPNNRSSEITTRLIRKREIEPLRRLLRMEFRLANCRVPELWRVEHAHYQLIRRIAIGRQDPLVQLVKEERWNDLVRIGNTDLYCFF